MELWLRAIENARAVERFVCSSRFLKSMASKESMGRVFIALVCSSYVRLVKMERLRLLS